MSARDGWAREIKKLYPDRILNGAVSGYDTCQELHWFRKLDAELQIDAVIVQMCPNDIDGSPVLVPKDDDSYRYFTGSSAFDIPQWVLHSHFLTYFMFQYGIQHVATSVDEQQMEKEQYTKQCLKELKEEVGERPFHAIIFPVLSDQRSEHLRGWNSEHQLRNIAQDLQVSHIFLREHMNDVQIKLLRERENDHVHPSSEGSLLFLEKILPFLRKDVELNLE